MTARPWALVTGGSSGIGLALACCLRERGWSVVLVARDERRLAAARGFTLNRPVWPQYNPTTIPAAWVQTRSVDVADADAMRALAVELLASHGAPRMLFTSAGIARPDHFDRLDDAHFREAMEINYFGTLNTVRAFAGAMRSARAGHVVLVSSAAGLVGVFGYAAYAPTKFAVRGLAEVLRAEFRPDGVKVHVLCPPDTDTPQLEQEELTKPAQTRAIAGNAGKLSPHEVANAVIAGIERGRFMIAPGLQTRLLAGLHSVLAPVLRRMFDRAADSAAGRAAQPRDSARPHGVAARDR